LATLSIENLALAHGLFHSESEKATKRYQHGAINGKNALLLPP
jgi:hypothetical protein